MYQDEDKIDPFHIILGSFSINCSYSDYILESRVIQDYKKRNPDAKFYRCDCAIEKEDQESVSDFLQTGQFHLNYKNYRSFKKLNKFFHFPKLEAKLNEFKRPQFSSDPIPHLSLLYKLIFEFAFSLEETIFQAKEIIRTYGALPVVRTIFYAILSRPLQTNEYIELVVQISSSFFSSFLDFFYDKFEEALNDKNFLFKNEVFYIAYYLLDNNHLTHEVFFMKFPQISTKKFPLMLVNFINPPIEDLKAKSGKTPTSFYENIDVLSQNNWELHKKLVEAGVNPNPIAVAIIKDDVEALKKLSCNPNFSPRMIIEKSIYERHSMASDYPLVINYALFYHSENCLDFLFSINPKCTKPASLKYAICGGGIDFFRNYVDIDKFKHHEFDFSSAIMYHRQDCIEFGLNDYSSSKMMMYAKLMIEYCEYTSLCKVLYTCNFSQQELAELLEYERENAKNSVVESLLIELIDQEN